MPRDITVTFDDGSTHVYRNAPDNITPESVHQRAQKDFGKNVTSLDGGRGAPPGVAGGPGVEPFKGKGTLAEYLFEPPEQKEFSPSEALTAGGITAGVMAAAPKVLTTVGKAAQFFPQPVAKGLGRGAETLGEVLQTTPLWRRLATGAVAGTAADVTEQAGEYEQIPRVVTLPVSMLVGSVGGYTTDLLSRATGIEARSLASGLRDQAIQLTKDGLEKAGLNKQQAQAEIARLQKIQRQLAERGGVAEKRVSGRQTPPFMQSERESVYSDLNTGTRQAQAQAKAAGLSVEQTEKVVADAQQKIINAQKAVDDLERKFLTTPSISKEQFGRKLRTTTQGLYDDLQTTRRAAAPFKQIISQAGNEPTVPTAEMYDALSSAISQTGNPTVRNILDTIRAELLTTQPTASGKADVVKRISLAKADSLKGFIDNVIHSKQFGETKLSKEILNQVRKTKSYLFDAIRPVHPEYMEALSAFRTASRPLDIVERNGGLAKIIERDPMSTEYVLQEAEIAGRIISKAKAGNKVFERLIDKNPDIKNSARLYFVKDLFGKETAPTEDAMRTWLKNNESVLKRIGIYDEFRNMRVARTTANQAVADAKGELEGAKQAFTRAQKIQRLSEEEQRRLGGLATKAGRRLEETLKTTEPIEKILAKLSARAKPAETRIGQELSGAERGLAQVQSEELGLRLLMDDLRRVRPREIPNRVKQLADSFAKEGRITPQQADALKRDVDKNLSVYASSDKAAKRVRQIVGASVLLGAGSSVYKGLTGQDTIRYNR